MMSTAHEIRTVIEDLNYIRHAWVSDPSDAELWRGSAILRRILIEGNLERCWRALGFNKELIIRAPNIDIVFSDRSNLQIPILFALGAEYRGIEIATMKLEEAPEGYVEGTKPSGLEKLGHYTDYSVHKYLQSSSAIKQEIDENRPGHFRTIGIARADVIKYVANNLGGVHIGESRHVKGRKIAMRVSRFERCAEIFGKDALFYEILAIGQCLTKSQSIKEMLDRFN